MDGGRGRREVPILTSERCNVPCLARPCWIVSERINKRNIAKRHKRGHVCYAIDWTNSHSFDGWKLRAAMGAIDKQRSKHNA